MVVDFGGEAVAKFDPRHPSVSVVDGSFDDVEVFQFSRTQITVRMGSPVPR